MSEGFQQLMMNLRALSPARQALLGLTTLGSLGFFAWLTLGLAADEYRPLYRGVDTEEASHITEALREERIDYKLDEGGTAILVPASVLHEARIRVAGRGLPGGAGVGLELFDTPAFGVSDFVHRVNFVRAIQGELARTIEHLEPVDRARVQVVIPERRSVLAASQRAPSASVVVALRGGRALDAAQAQSIVQLVASSIEDLSPDGVTVVDTEGRLLAPLEDGLPGSVAAAAGGVSYQQRLEQDLASRIERLLEKTLGAGNVTARVRADLDWTESETTEENFDPDSQVARSEQRSTESEQEGAGTGGAAGAVANLPGLAGASSGGNSAASRRTSETINYEISKTIRRSVTPMGEIERLSVAVLVADRPAAEPGGAPQPWPEESLGLFESLARQAVGFDSERGDEITVRSAPFHAPAVALEPEGFRFTEWLPIASIVVRGLLVLVALLLFAKLVVKPVVASVPAAAPSLPARLEDLEAALDGTAALPAGNPTPLPAATETKAEDGARALRNWLNQG